MQPSRCFQVADLSRPRHAGVERASPIVRGGPAAAGVVVGHLTRATGFRIGDKSELGSLDDIFGVHLGLAHAAMVQDFKREVEDLRVTPKQAALLWLAEQTPGIAQIEVARLLRVDRATILGITNKLVSRRLVARGKARNDGPKDARRVGLHLTAAGLDVLLRAREAIAIHEKRYLQRLTRAELEVVLPILKKLYV
jgi:DNA-binding MarR family transcriptional regulator